MSENAVTPVSFGNIAVQLGYTTIERINECAQIQHKIRQLGIPPKKLGEIMLDKGYLTEEQVKHIFRVQGLKGGHTQVAGYKIIGLIGQGSMGKVYKALQISMDRIVALKILAPHLAQNEKFVTRFFQEARIVAKLNHPNIMQGIDVGESNGVHYFAMEYIDGPELANLVKKSGPLEERPAIEVILQVSRALEHAHKHNLVHRDIKPANIMINQENTVKLCDLGLARLPTGEIKPGEKRVIMGTPAYISPEQAQGLPDIDVRSDIYSLGATFYYILLGVLLFPAETTTELIRDHLTKNPIPPRAKKPTISLLTNNIILKMLAKRREERFQTPQELTAQLETALNSSAARPAPAPHPGISSKRIMMLSRMHRFPHLNRPGIHRRRFIR